MSPAQAAASVWVPGVTTRDSNRYTGILRFDTYLNGVYTGYTTIDRDTVLDGADTAAGPVVVTAYDSNGNQLIQLCGMATQHRL